MFIEFKKFFQVLRDPNIFVSPKRIYLGGPMFNQSIKDM